MKKTKIVIAGGGFSGVETTGAVNDFVREAAAYYPDLSEEMIRRMVYPLKLPRLAKKLRVVRGWTLELLFSREIEQMITLRDVEELTNRLTRIRERTEKEISRPARTASDPQAHLTLLRGK